MAAIPADIRTGIRNGALPLRQALDWLRDTVAPRSKRKAAKSSEIRGRPRNEYINVILNRWPDET